MNSFDLVHASDEDLERAAMAARHRQAHDAMVDGDGTRLKCKNPKCGRLWHGLPVQYCEGSHKWESK